MPSAYSTDPNSNQSPADIANVNRLGKMQSGQNPGPQWEGAHSWETPHTNPYTGATTTPTGSGFQPGSIAANPLQPSSAKPLSSSSTFQPGSIAANPLPSLSSGFNSLNPESQSKINGAIGAVSHEGTPLVATAENAAAVGKSAAEHLGTPTSSALVPSAPSAGGALAETGGAALANSATKKALPLAGAAVGGTTTAGLIGSGLAGAAAGVGTYALGDKYIPRAPEDGGYLHGVVNNLRDIGLAGVSGAVGGATQGGLATAPIGGIGALPGAVTGAIGGLGAGIFGKLYGAGKEAYDYAKGAINSSHAIADSNKSLAAAGHPQPGATPSGSVTSPTLNTSLPAGLTITPNAGIMNGVDTPKPTAQSQITPLNGISNGMPVAPGIVNNPAPVGQPAKAPAPAAKKEFAAPTADEMAAFRKQTGTKFNPKSINDKLSLERMRGGEETFDSKQANAYRASHPEYRPGQYVRS